MALDQQGIESEFRRVASQAGLHTECLGTGNIEAELILIGERPGPKEVSSKMNFFGESGKLLWKNLRNYGFHRSNTYATNVAKRDRARINERYVEESISKEEMVHWEHLLHWELDHLPNLKYIVALGDAAMHALIGETGITKMRGYVAKRVRVGRQQREVTVLFTNNPAATKYQDHIEPTFRFDLSKIPLIVEGKWSDYKVESQYNLPFKGAMDYLRFLHTTKEPISFDIETIYNETACIGFADDPHFGVCINFRRDVRGENDSVRRDHMYSRHEEADLRSAIQDLFNDQNLSFIAQNGTFDCYWLLYKDRIRARVGYDTLLAHHTLYPTWPHNLGFLTSQYTTHPYYKDEGEDWKESGDIDSFWDYNVKDVCITKAVANATRKELINQGLFDFFTNHVMRLQPHLVNMTVNGVKVDTELKDKIAADMEIDVAKIKKKFADLAVKCTGDESIITYNKKGILDRPNIDSPKQMAELLYDKLGLHGRKRSTNKHARASMRSHHETTREEVELLDTFDEYKEEKKFHSTYATMTLDEDGRIRSEYRQFGTQSAPGRLSSAHNMWGSGMNMQNQPHRAYPMFIADPGWMFTYFDMSQAEARVVAYTWHVKALIENFERAASEGLDVHRMNGSRIFRIPYEEIPEKDWDENLKPTKRYLGKRCVHGLNYRMGPPKLAEVCNIDILQAEAAYRAYHLAFPQIKQAWSATITEARTKGELWSCMGRRIIFLQSLFDDEILDSVVAFRPQSAIGDKVCQVIYKCHEDPRWPRDSKTKRIQAHAAINIHDAVITLHRPEDTEIVSKLMKQYAEEPLIIHEKPVIIPAEIKHSKPDEKGIHRWSSIE